jgi:hypothetical protein
MATGGVFPYVEYRDYGLIDGSLKYGVDLLDAITQCEAMGFKDTDIIIDAVLTKGKTINEVDASEYTTLEVLWRYLEISNYYSTMGAINDTVHDHPDVNLRHVIFPIDDLPGIWLDISPYGFTGADAAKMIAIGEAQVKKELQTIKHLLSS